MSPDGSKLLVCARTGRVVLSNDAGSTWGDLNGGQSQYADCSMSADACLQMDKQSRLLDVV